MSERYSNNELLSQNYKLLVENRALLGRNEWLEAVVKDLIAELEESHDSAVHGPGAELGDCVICKRIAEWK
jgi:hypothetical protein